MCFAGLGFYSFAQVLPCQVAMADCKGGLPFKRYCGTTAQCRPPHPRHCSAPSCYHPEPKDLRFSERFQCWLAECPRQFLHKIIYKDGRYFGQGCSRGIQKAAYPFRECYSNRKRTIPILSCLWNMLELLLQLLQALNAEQTFWLDNNKLAQEARFRTTTCRL